MTETWLHVGMPKCGSTTLQRHFAEHEAAHLEHGVLYPETGRAPDGYRCHRPLMLAGGDLPRLAAGIAAEARAKGAARLVVSSEGYAASQPGDPRGPAVARALAEATGAPVRVVAWLRHPGDLAVSSYAQFVKAGIFGVHRHRFWKAGPGSVARYLAAFEAARGRDILSALGHAEALHAAFDGHEIVLRSAEAADLGRDLLDDMCAFFGLPRLGGPARRNTRPPERATALISEAQERHGPGAYDAKRRELTPWLAAQDPAGFAPARLRLPAEAQDRLNALMARERAALRALFATPVDAMTAERPADPGEDVWLTPAELAELERRMAA